MPDIMKIGDPPRFLGSWDVMDGELTLTIADFKEEVVEGEKGLKERKCVLYFAEKDVLPMICNLTNRKMLAKLYHTTDSAKLKGKLVLIGTDKVKAFGKIHDALRIRATIPTGKAQTAPAKDSPKCAECGKPIAAAGGMNPEQVAQYTAKKYGKALCGECATKAASAVKDGAE